MSRITRGKKDLEWYEKKLRLDPEHRQWLRESSGISREVVRDFGFRSVSHVETLFELGFGLEKSREIESLGSALLLPWTSIDGSWVPTIRPARPVDGAKYLWPARTPMCLFVPRSVLGRLKRTKKRPIIFIEGLKKVAKYLSDWDEGRDPLPVGLNGVWGWSGGRPSSRGHKKSSLIADFDQISFEGRNVYVAFDSDCATSAPVRLALERFVELLRERESVVRIIVLPESEGGAKTGVDDYLMDGHSVSELLALAGDELPPSPGAAMVRKLNDRYALVMQGKRSYVLEPTPIEDLGPGSRRPIFELREISALKPIYENDSVETVLGGKLRVLNPVDIWIKSQERRTYNGIDWNPGGETDPGFFNAWRGFTVCPVPGDARRYFDHIHEVICGGRDDVFQYVKRWMAHIFQRPGELPRVALLVYGVPGCGKNAFADRLVDLTSPYGVALDYRTFEERFNSALQWKVLAVADEAAFMANPRVTDRLKALITQPTMTIEQKFVDPFTVRNALRFIFLTNNRNALHADLFERRYVVLEASSHRAQDSAYFEQLFKFLNRPETLPAILAELLAVDLSNFKPSRDWPRTEELFDQKLRSLRGVERFLFERLDAGELLIHDPTSPRGWPNGPVSKDALLNEYERWRANRPNEREIPRSTFFKEVKRLIQTDRSRATVGGKRLWRIVLPSLPEARARFERSMGQSVPWEDGGSARQEAPRKRRKAVRVPRRKGSNRETGQ